MAEAQDWKCYICHEEKPLEVDHDHKTGKVRKLLCRECNVLAGWVEKFRHRLAGVLKYFEEFV